MCVGSNPAGPTSNVTKALIIKAFVVLGMYSFHFPKDFPSFNDLKYRLIALAIYPVQINLESLSRIHEEVIEIPHSTITLTSWRSLSAEDVPTCSVRSPLSTV